MAPDFPPGTVCVCAHAAHEPVLRTAAAVLDAAVLLLLLLLPQ